MTIRTFSAPRLARTLTGAVLALAVAGGAAAQAQQAQKPAPAAPAQQQAAQAQQQPQVTAIPIPWVKQCQRDQTRNKEVCSLEQSIISDLGQPLVRFGIFEVKDDALKAFNVAFPTGMGILLRNGFRVALAGEQPVMGTFVMCDQQFCRGDIQVDQAFIDRMKKAQGVTLQVANGTGRLISLPIGLGDFSKAYDGPVTDQKVFEEEIKKIQDQVKTRVEALQAEAAARDQQTKAGLEKLGAEKLKNAQPAQ